MDAKTQALVEAARAVLAHFAGYSTFDLSVLRELKEKLAAAEAAPAVEWVPGSGPAGRCFVVGSNPDHRMHVHEIGHEGGTRWEWSFRTGGTAPTLELAKAAAMAAGASE